MNISLVIMYGYGYVKFTENIHHLNQENSELKTAVKVMQDVSNSITYMYVWYRDGWNYFGWIQIEFQLYLFWAIKLN